MEKIEIKSMSLSLISYKDDEAYYWYCPALELTGYGDDEKQAQESFKIVLEEYIRYTTENQTLIADLKSLGWKVTQKGNKLQNFFPYFLALYNFLLYICTWESN